MAFKIHRGTNLSHWLSQSDRRGPERAAWLTREDVQRIAAHGYDHVRIPVDEEQMWDPSGREEPEAFALLEGALGWCHEAGLRAVVDLHILRSHHFNQKDAPALYSDPKQAEHFGELWRSLSARLRRWPNDEVAYELMNEAVAPSPAEWNRVYPYGLRAVRESEPERQVIVGSNRWNSADTFDELAVPDDPNVILTFHFYNPMLVTHYRASWTEVGKYDGPIQYPGSPIPPEAFAALSPEMQQWLEPQNRPYGKEQMRQAIAKPLAVRARTGKPLYCGEFGVITRAPEAVRAAWYHDFAALMAEEGIAWANWDYKGSFNIFGSDGGPTAVSRALLGG